MRTPAGKECDFYYEDFHRGRELQECRIQKAPQSLPWHPKDCAKCPVPDILRANSSRHLRLELNIQTRMLGMGRKIEVRAWCDKHGTSIENPFTGCPKCNAERPGLALFAEAMEEIDD